MPKERARYQKGKGKGAKGEGRRDKENRKEKKVITRAKVRAKTTKERVWQLVTLVGSQDRDWRNNIRQVASDIASSSSGGASVTIHTVGQQQAKVSQQSSPAEWSPKPVVSWIENSGPIFDLREGHDEAEDHGIRVIHL